MTITKKLLYIVFFAFIVNLAWEVPHSLLYKTTTEMSVSEYVPRILQASAGDIVMILIIFAIISLYNNSVKWSILQKKNIILSILLGIIVSVTFEIYALNTNKFAYLPSMPLIPLLNVGITPVLQMIVAPLIVFFLAEKISL